MDEGSTLTMIDAAVAKRIGTHGPKEPLSLQGAGSMCITDHDSQRVSFKISDAGSSNSFPLVDVRTMNGLNLPRQTLTPNELDAPHLRDTQCTPYTDIAPVLLIGQDNWELSMPQEIRRAEKGDLVATRTMLGWVIHGQSWAQVKKRISSYTLCSSLDSSDQDTVQSDPLNALVKSYFHIDSLGISNTKKRHITNEKAERMLLEKTVWKDGRWTTCLLWKDEETIMPDNYKSAMNRLKNLERKLDKNPDFKRAYSDQITKLIDAAYAKRITSQTLETKQRWYLPHFAVTNPNKPGKLRIVFDPAATCQGTSLNDKLMEGPDYLQRLPGVLARFRQKPIAFTADIKDMFLRIQINSDDQQYQRFLWRGDDRQREPDIYVMQSLIFGAKSSPCTALFVKNRNAEKYAEKFPKAVTAIKLKHYMDDYVDSVNSVSEARQIISEMSEIHERGGFQIRQWACNEPAVLKHLPADNLAIGQVKIPNVEGNLHRTLGLIWNPDADAFCFNLDFNRFGRDIMQGKKYPTKRLMLSIIMSVFDPLGFIAPIFVRSKILLQNVWRSGTEWDAKIRDSEFQQWRHWVRDLFSVANFHLPRCYVDSPEPPISIELHTFCDASEVGHAAVAYWRFEYSDRRCHVAFAMGKSRVSPLKHLTIPKLEFQAALMGSRLAGFVQEEHEYKVSKRVFWTDSSTVLKWIRSEPTSHTAYLANRLGEIDENTERSEWRWLSSAENPADEATRENVKEMSSNSRWIAGPTFLRKAEETWPQLPATIINEPTYEPRDHLLTTVVCAESSILPNIDKLSSWARIINATASVLYFIDICRGANRTGVSRVHMLKAEVLWIHKVQHESFEKEIAAIKRGSPIAVDSRLRYLSPWLDDDGILRVESRIKQVDGIHSQAATPVILDGKHRYVKLLVMKYHRSACHGSNETVVNELRQKYWVLNLRSCVRSVSSSCLFCRIRRAKPTVPRIADLPKARLGHHQRPFTFCGVDYFGPMLVTVGRKNEKRWGVLFTCLTTRAVHLELAVSLTTDSTIMALRRMAARRGFPSHIYSDNGTNLRGAFSEMKVALEEVKPEDLGRFANYHGAQWHFIPPAAPHMGGAWERLVQSVKRALQVTLKERKPKEEVLFTLLLEAEHIINSRPLTHVSSDHRDPEALTPNHILIGSSSGVPINLESLMMETYA